MFIPVNCISESCYCCDGQTFTCRRLLGLAATIPARSEMANTLLVQLAAVVNLMLQNLVLKFERHAVI